MIYRVEYIEKVKKSFKKLDKAILKRIINYMKEIETLDNPRIRGKQLS